MSSSFFTNQEENTLKNKINNVLQINKNVEYLDFLIGYFRITGFDKISDNLSNIKHTRILVGINADKSTFDASQLIEKFANEQVGFYNEEPLDMSEYLNFESMRDLIIAQKIEVRISANRDVHSKMYIMRSDELPNYRGDGTTFVGSVIIGSSNLTHNGLEGNTEINAELNQERDIVDAVEVFQKLWDSSVALDEDDFDSYIMPKLKEPNPSLYQLYIKFLIEHFGKRIDFIDDENMFVPSNYKKLSYQIEAVNDGLAKLKEHNGFFLSDVVGLGKTVVVAMLIKKLEPTLSKKILVIIPPAVHTQWLDTFVEFDINICDIVSLAKLSSVDSSQYYMVVVDESHKFKNSNSQRYKQLYEICLNKKVILLSATPQNNTPKDLYNQISLFQNVKNSTLPNCKNLQGFFVNIEKIYKDILKSQPIDEMELKRVSEDIRDNILRTIMIRRTRYDIQHHNMYKTDIEEQGLSMPKVNEPKEHQYKLNGKIGKIFDETAIKITKGLNYSRFNLLYYLTKEAQKRYYPNESDNIFIKNPLAGIMKTLLIKRFESSFFAFKISISRHLKRYQKFIEHFENDIIYLGDKATDILDYDNDEDKGRVKQLSKTDFKDGFADALKSDLNIFTELVEIWKDIDKDPKLDKFRELIVKDMDKKVVIFTESVDTLEYLKDRLLDIPKILFITSKNREEKNQTIKENFDANYTTQKNNYNIIITTDTLAEGINLHRSSIIYNYDIPWNATKLIQRIGRVNRIGTKAKFIDIHNFKPASHIENLIELSQKAFVKLQSSHTMMGEDSQIYTKKEQVSSVNLFHSYEQETKERDDELFYLEELREFREKNPKEFEQIKKLKNGLNVTRKSDKNSAYITLNINGQKNYVCVNDNDNVKLISFITMAEALRPKSSEKPIQNQENTKYISKAIAHFEHQIKNDQKEKSENRADSKMEEEARSLLKEWLKKKIISRDELKTYREAISGGNIGDIGIKQLHKLKQNPTKDIAKALKGIITKHKRVENEEVVIKNCIKVKSVLYTKV